MKKDNLQYIIEVFTNRGFDVSIVGWVLWIKDNNYNRVEIRKDYIKTHRYIDDLIIEISSQMKQLQKKEENNFIKEIINKRVSSHVDLYLHTGQDEHVITIPPCEISRYELLKDEFNKYRTIKFEVLNIWEDGLFQSIKYRISNK